jgi:hypothetical protein
MLSSRHVLASALSFQQVEIIAWRIFCRRSAVPEPKRRRLRAIVMREMGAG